MSYTYLALSGLLLAVGIGLWAIAAIRRQVTRTDYLALAVGAVVAYMADSWHFSWSSWVPNPNLTLGHGFLAGIPLLGVPDIEELVVIPALMAFYSGFYVALGRRDGPIVDRRWPQLMVVMGLMGLWFTLMWPGGANWDYITLLFARLTVLGLLLLAVPRWRWLLVSAALAAPGIILWTTVVIAVGVFSYGAGTLAHAGTVWGLLTPEEYVAIGLDAMLGPAVIQCARHLRAVYVGRRKVEVWRSRPQSEAR